ncbi:MAG TPA: secretion system protein [Desulfotomaculum sp.]|nr:MAG: secretion system protein [Desulfotomaculum sp. BICA1-6]HBX23169.1 secretion system protein [Desulfotomaculum sp.]
MSLAYIAGLVFTTVILTILGVYSLKTVSEQEFSQRMARILKKKDGKPGEAGVDRLKGAGGGLYRGLKKILSATPLKRRVEKELTRADLPLRGEEFMAFTVIGLGGVLLSVLIFTGSLLTVLSAMVVMLPAPYVFISRARQKRLQLFNSQISDALVIIANSLRSGFSFLQAMDLVRREMPDPIAKEFGRAFQEINLGTPTEQALTNMAERVDSDDLDMVITAVLIQRQVGGNLAEVLDKIAHTIKERIRIKGEIKTLTAQGRISGIVIGLMPVALCLFLYVSNPEYISLLFNNQVGLIMVGAALIAQGVGFFAIRRIVDIKY